ncbi:hypothetical protein UFOVP83_51 [uncultured Caudovirales phage]|uniref:Uncharacterized protein n=1 Tax=uncultured Caudovirales phage TaxID=2100421 RepID=A0A6J5TBE9_9CAUD|nr:hypothetical protein UFOVP83_51 [uncultured Caudovirales phage]
MKIYAYREQGSGKSKWQGIAVAATHYDLFWQIDQHFDPYNCDIISFDRPFSFCALTNGSGYDVRLIDVELSDDVFDHFSDEEQWKNAKSFASVESKTKSAVLVHISTNEESK